MKLEPIGRALVRYFRQAATSLRGKVSRTPAHVAYFLDAAGDLHANYGGPVSERLTSISNPDALRAAPRGADEQPPMTWNIWSEMQREVERPGWTFCRFGVRSPNDGVGQVFGYVRDGFGMYGKSYHVCGSISGVRQLWSLVHLRSGLGLGLFATPSEAGEAGDIAIRLNINLVNDDMPAADWHRLQSAWRAASFNIGRDIYAHQILNDQIVPGELYVWQYDITSDVTSRPERLS